MPTKAEEYFQNLGKVVLRDAVPLTKCLELAGEGKFRVYREHEEGFIEITFDDGSTVVLGMGEGQ